MGAQRLDRHRTVASPGTLTVPPIDGLANDTHSNESKCDMGRKCANSGGAALETLSCLDIGPRASQEIGKALSSTAILYGGHRRHHVILTDYKRN